MSTRRARVGVAHRPRPRQQGFVPAACGSGDAGVAATAGHGPPGCARRGPLPRALPKSPRPPRSSHRQPRKSAGASRESAPSTLAAPPRPAMPPAISRAALRIFRSSWAGFGSEPGMPGAEGIGTPIDPCAETPGAGIAPEQSASPLAITRGTEVCGCPRSGLKGDPGKTDSRCERRTARSNCRRRIPATSVTPAKLADARLLAIQAANRLPSPAVGWRRPCVSAVLKYAAQYDAGRHLSRTPLCVDAPTRC